MNKDQPDVEPIPNPYINLIPWKKGEEKIRVLMFALQERWWLEYGERVYRALAAHPQISPLVIFSPPSANTPGVFAPVQDFDSFRNTLVNSEIPFTYVRCYDPAQHRPQVVLYSPPYAIWHPPSLRPQVLADLGVRVAAYVGYATAAPAYNRQIVNITDELIHKCAWRIFAPSRFEYDLFAQYGASGAASVRITGSPKFDFFSDSKAKRPDIAEKAEGRPVIGYFSGNFNWITSDGNGTTTSTLPSIGKSIIDLAGHRNDAFFVVRLHPTAMAQIKYETPVGRAWRRYVEGIKNCPNMLFDEHLSALPAMSSADAVISDFSSVLLESLPTLKPILYLKPPDWLPMVRQLKPLEDSLYQAADEKGVEKFVEMVVRGEDPRLEQRRAQIDYVISKTDGRAAERIAEEIVRGMEEEPGFIPRPPWLTPIYDASESYWMEEAPSPRELDPHFNQWKKESLENFISSQGPFKNIIDIGCGDGFYTELFAPAAARINGFDISEKFIQSARISARQQGHDNIFYTIGDERKESNLMEYDLILSLNLFSCLHGNFNSSRLLDRLEIFGGKRARLIVCDTFAPFGDLVGRAPSPRHRLHNRINFRYRGADGFMAALNDRGFELLSRQDRQLDEPDDRGLFDSLMVFRKNVSDSGLFL